MTDFSFSLTLLGLPVIRRREADGRYVELRWRLRRVLLALAYLALAPDRRARKEELIHALWPDGEPDSIARNFHPTLSDARRMLAGRRKPDRSRPLILYRQGVYSLDPQIDWRVDVRHFEDQIRHGRASLDRGDDASALGHWTEAWNLYRGHLLAEHDQAWIVHRRRSLRDAYLRLLDDLARLCTRVDRVTQAIDAFRTILLEEPYEEHVHRALMKLYGRQGRRDLVRRQYVRLQEWLEELDVEPLEETQRTYHELMG